MKFKQSPCVNFVNLLKEVRIRGHNNNCNNGKEYITTYNGFNKATNYISMLNKQMQECRSELQHLPLTQPKRDGRIDYVVILYKNFHRAKQKVENPKILQTLNRKFSYIYCGNEANLKRFPKRYSAEKHPTNKDYQNHKVHFMYAYHKKVINHVIEQIKFLSGNKELLNSLIIPNSPFVNHLTFPKGKSETQPIPKFKTSLSVNQLACFFDLIAEHIVEDLSKKEIAIILSQIFETPKSKQPSVHQIYKAFYNVDESTKEIIKNIILKMLHKIK